MSHITKVPCVSAILYNADKQVLLQQRDDKPDLAFAGYWTLFGGKVEYGETPDMAMRRELMEEIELQPDLTYWKTYNSPRTTNLVVIQHIYLGKIHQTLEDITLNEGQALNYFYQHELSKLNIAFGFEEILDKFFHLNIS